MNSTSTLNKINELYLRSGYMDKYGKDLWISFILCISFIIIICYQNLINTFEFVKTDWPNFRCNPLFMPFAGFINKPSNLSNVEYTAENFSGCITSILYFAAEIAFEPFKIILIILNEAIQALVDSFNAMRGLIDRLRTNYAAIFNQIYASMANLVVAFITFVAQVKDTMTKINGILTTILYSLFGAYMAIESLFLSMIDLMVIILFVLGAVAFIYIYLSIGLFPIPFIGPAVAAPSITTSIIIVTIMIAIMIPVIWFMAMMMKVLNLSSPPLPGIPRCFAENTLIPLFKCEEKIIKNIQIGEQLKNGGTVTSIMQFTSNNQDIYNLNNVMVSGEHRVFHQSSHQWIKVKNHPESQYVPDFNEPYIYCFNTDNKEFVIADIIFSDWDDIDVKVLNDLQINCVNKGYLPLNFLYSDIHQFLESGLHPTTAITLNNGLIIPINEIEINDILVNNTKVLGIIKIQGKDIKHYKHIFDHDNFIRGSKNIHIHDTNLGIINCMDIDSKQTHHAPVLYHLLTDTKFFVANNIKIHDYNYGIDAYLN